MVPMNSQIFESYLPVYDAVPEKWDEAREFLVERLKEISNAINVREIGWFLDEELLSGKAFIPGINGQGNAAPTQFRSVLRKVIDFGPLPAAGAKSVPHGIVFDSNFTLVQLYAAATNPNGLFALPIPYVEIAAPAKGGIQIYMDSANVNIFVGSDRSTYTRCYVTIEYLQEL